MNKLISAVLVAASGLVMATAAQASPQLPIQRAHLAPLATHVPLTTVTEAGGRLVAAGDYGVVLLSDDDGHHWRQAREVQTTTLITSLAFTDAAHGWATAHGGLLLSTADGGEHWTVANHFGPDVVPLGIAFDGTGAGVIVGTYGFAMRTSDGGKTWAKTHLDGGDIPDRHLNFVLATAPGAFVVAAEAGAIFRSTDGGATWARDDLPIIGSLWTATKLHDGSVLVAGMGGRLYRREGDAWREQKTGTDESLTSVAELPNGSVVAVGLAGTVVVSQDGGQSFRAVPRPDRDAYAAAIGMAAGQVTVFGSSGVKLVDMPK